MSHCVHCGGRHLTLSCAEFRSELLKPSPGICGRCGGEATFRPTVVSREPYRVEAMLICPCCSYPACQHRCPFVDADGVQCRRQYAHGALRSLTEGQFHDCRRDDNVRVAQYSGRFEPRSRTDQPKARARARVARIFGGKRPRKKA